jgi:hypothetical protein
LGRQYKRQNDYKTLEKTAGSCWLSDEILNPDRNPGCFPVYPDVFILYILFSLSSFNSFLHLEGNKGQTSFFMNAMPLGVSPTMKKANRAAWQ